MLAAFATIGIRKNEVGGYAYNNVNTLITEIKRVLAEQLFEDSMDGMKGLLSTTKNTLPEYKATISIKRKDVLRIQRTPLIISPLAVEQQSNQKSLRTATPRKRRTGKTPTDWQQSGSKKGWQRASPRSSEKTSPTRSSARQMASVSIQWTAISSTNLSPPS